MTRKQGMREIMFRTWDGHKMITDGLVICNGDLYMDWRDFENGITSDNPLMQYTGFKDKNGVKIFEGDVVEFEHGGRVRAYVIYKDGSFEVKNDKADVFLYLYVIYHKAEVIGSIHDNQEFMEERP